MKEKLSEKNTWILELTWITKARKPIADFRNDSCERKDVRCKRDANILDEESTEGLQERLQNSISSIL